jgi:prophage maintenance system killer protein
MCGVKNPVSADEITQINQSYGGQTLLNGSPENALVNASRYNSFWEKSAVMIRDIAGSHMFDNGNKRTAFEVVSQMMDRNNVISGPTSDDLWGVIARVSDAGKPGHTLDIGGIASMLRGYE